MDKKDFAFGRMNFILLGVGMLIVVIGFILMSGDSTTPDAYNPDIFSARRIKVAPVVCFLGFVSMIYAVVYKPGSKWSFKTWLNNAKELNSFPSGVPFLILLGMILIAFGFVLRLSSKTPEPIETTGMWWGEMLMITGSAWVVGMLITLFIKKGKISKEA